MSDAERIRELEKEVADLKAKIDFVLKSLGFNEAELLEFRQLTTIPAPPPDGV